MQKHYKQNKNTQGKNALVCFVMAFHFHSSERKLMACDHDFCELLFNDMHFFVSLS